MPPWSVSGMVQVDGGRKLHRLPFSVPQPPAGWV
jgi:hypothetical protein